MAIERGVRPPCLTDRNSIESFYPAQGKSSSLVRRSISPSYPRSAKNPSHAIIYPGRYTKRYKKKKSNPKQRKSLQESNKGLFTIAGYCMQHPAHSVAPFRTLPFILAQLRASRKSRYGTIKKPGYETTNATRFNRAFMPSSWPPADRMPSWRSHHRVQSSRLGCSRGGQRGNCR